MDNSHRLARGLRAGRTCPHCNWGGYENHDYICTGGCKAAFKIRVVGFCGSASSGKSTAAERLIGHWRFERIRFAGPLKAMMVALGLSSEEIDGDLKERPCALFGGKTPRQAMQWLGTEWGRELVNPSLWIDAWKVAVDREPDRLIVVDDVRFSNEAQAIRERGGIVVKIERPGAVSESGSGHISERFEFEPDLVIRNDVERAAFLKRIDVFADSLRQGSSHGAI